MSTASRQEGPAKKKRRTGLVRAACDVCRRRKLSCDGKRPQCTRCQQQGVPDCSYDTQSSEETRSMALKRQVDNLQATLDQVATSFTALKDLPAEASARMLVDVAHAENPIMELLDIGRRVQTQRLMLHSRISALESARATFPSIKSSLEFELNILHPLAYPTFAGFERYDELAEQSQISIVRVGQGQSSRLRDIVASRANDSLGALNIRSWTKVPISNELAALAIKVYLLTDHPLLGHFDAELFLADLLARQTEFCSEFLIKLTAFEKDAAALTEAFRLESERLWEADKSANMLTLSGLSFLLAGSMHVGRAAEGSQFLADAVGMGKELHVWGAPAGDNEKSIRYTAKQKRMLAFAAWGAFAHSVFFAFRWWERVPPEPPWMSVPKPNDIFADSDDTFLVLSVADTRRSLQTFVALCNNLVVLRDAVVEFNRVMKSGTPQLSLLFAQSIYRRLLQGTDNDTPLLETGVADGPDYVAIVRMWFQIAVMDIFQPFVHRRETLQGFTASDSTARALYMSSLRQLQHLVLLYRFRSPLALATPLWHGCIFFVAKAVLTINITRQSKDVFRLCVLMYADLVVGFPGLLDLFRAMLGMGMHAGFVTPSEAAVLVDTISKRRGSLRASPEIDLSSIANLSLDDDYQEAAHPQIDADGGKAQWKEVRRRTQLEETDIASDVDTGAESSPRTSDTA